MTAAAFDRPVILPYESPVITEYRLRHSLGGETETRQTNASWT